VQISIFAHRTWATNLLWMDPHLLGR